MPLTFPTSLLFAFDIYLDFRGELLHPFIDGIYQLVLDTLKYVSRDFLSELAHTCTTVIAIEEGDTDQAGCSTPCNSSLLQQFSMPALQPGKEACLQHIRDEEEVAWPASRV